jgi:hypothetical protein
MAKRVTRKNKRGGRPRKPVTERAKADRRTPGSTVDDEHRKSESQTASTGRHRCARIIKGKNGEPDRQCKAWAQDGSDYCNQHGAAGQNALLEREVERGNMAVKANGLKRAVSGRFGELFEVLARELGDDDLSQELAAARAMLATQLRELSEQYTTFEEEAERMKGRSRLEYWRTYNALLKTTRSTLESIRKIVATVADVKHKQQGNTLTMVQVTVLVGELVNAMTEIIGDDVEKLEQLRSALDRLEWIPS